MVGSMMGYVFTAAASFLAGFVVAALMAESWK